MKIKNLIAILTAASATIGASSPALAYTVCVSPASGFNDYVTASSQAYLHLFCLSADDNDVIRYAEAQAFANQVTDWISATLIQGEYAYTSAYNANRQLLGCYAEDFTAGNNGTSTDCGSGVSYYRLYTSNFQ